jgi:hypothetical protein
MTRRNTLTKLSTSLFTWTKGDSDGFGGVFGIDVSELQYHGGEFRLIFEDPALGGAVGFTLVSAKSEREATFVVTRIEKNLDDEITCWILEPLFSSYNQPGCHRLQHVTVRVYNT